MKDNFLRWLAGNLRGDRARRRRRIRALFGLGGAFLVALTLAACDDTLKPVRSCGTCKPDTVVVVDTVIVEPPPAEDCDTTIVVFDNWDDCGHLHASLWRRI